MNHLIGHKNTKIQKYKNNNHKKGGQIQREVYVRADMCCVERQKKGRRWPTSMAALIDAKRLFDTLEEEEKKNECIGLCQNERIRIVSPKNVATQLRADRVNRRVAMYRRWVHLLSDARVMYYKWRKMRKNKCDGLIVWRPLSLSGSAGTLVPLWCHSGGFCARHLRATPDYL